MVLVKVKDPNTGENYEYYMDDKLNRQLEKKVKGALNQKDEDYVLLIDGFERTGKSTFAMQLGKKIDPSLNLDRVCFSPDEFRKAILNAERRQCIIFDEAYRGLSAKGVLTEVNKILISLLMEIGQKNLFIIIVLPTFYLIEKYVALWRTRGLFHVYRKRGRKGYWIFFNIRKKTSLYLKGKKDYSYRYVKSSFRGRFYGKYTVSEEEYRKKKAKALKEGYKTTKQEKFQEQRDKLLCILYELNDNSLKKTTELLSINGVQLKRSQISSIVAKFRGRTEK